jgi:hypothetical protein
LAALAKADEQLAEVEARHAEVEARHAEVQRDLLAIRNGAVDPEELRIALSDLEPIWTELFPRERARLLELLLERVVLDAREGEVEIAFRAGGPGAALALARGGGA